MKRKKFPSGYADGKSFSSVAAWKALNFYFSKALKFILWIEFSITRLRHIRREKMRTVKSIVLSLVSLIKFADLITTHWHAFRLISINFIKSRAYGMEQSKISFFIEENKSKDNNFLANGILFYKWI